MVDKVDYGAVTVVNPLMDEHKPNTTNELMVFHL